MGLAVRMEVAGVGVSSGIIMISGILPPAVVGQPYSATLDISGGEEPYTIDIISGDLPAGLTATIDGSVITISGTPE